MRQNRKWLFDLPDIATAWRVSPEESKEKLAVSAKAQLDKAFRPV